MYMCILVGSRQYILTDLFCCLGVQLHLQKSALVLWHLSLSCIVVLSCICRSFGLALGHGPYLLTKEYAWCSMLQALQDRRVGHSGELAAAVL